jgi:Mn-dependent DtxR family transcriptional regulator
MNAPRFPSALQIMQDLALIEASPDQGYRLLPEGEALLEKFRHYQIPTPQSESRDETAEGD